MYVNLQLESSHHCTSVVSKKSSMHIPLLNQLGTLMLITQKKQDLCPRHANSPRLPWIAIEDKSRGKETEARVRAEANLLEFKQRQMYTNLQTEVILHWFYPWMAVTGWICNLELQIAEGRDICPGHVNSPNLPWITIEGKGRAKAEETRITYPEANVLPQIC